MLKVALAGKPNCGKSTLFNALTGLNQKTANFPGVTVDKKTGNYTLSKKDNSDLIIQVIDLPGIYSLYPNSPDEVVAVNILTDEENADKPDVVVFVADACNLKQCLFLCTQIIDLQIPLILALNMSDLAEKKNIETDIKFLSELLGVPVIKIVAAEKKGIDQLNLLLSEGIVNPIKKLYPLPEENRSETTLYDYRKFYKRNRINATDDQSEKAFWRKNQLEETIWRHQFIKNLLQKVSKRKEEIVNTERNKKLDDILTHIVWGPLIFVGVMFCIFQFLFTFSAYPMNWIELGFSFLSEWLSKNLPSGVFADLLINGVIAGLSGVVVFIPQIAFLFAFIAFLEDSGYMARVSFITDRLMRPFGLNGRSVIPLISGVACAVPAIMSTRTISNWKERLITIMVTPLISCSARLPVFTLIVTLIVPEKYVWGFLSYQALAMMLLYLFSVFMALLIAFILKFLIKTKERSIFIMEMPSYKLPLMSAVMHAMYEKVKVFVMEAGKIIIAISIVLWFLSSYGPADTFENIDKKYASLNEAHLTESQKKLLDVKMASEKLSFSYAGMLGKKIEPLIKPLGYDWKLGIAIITSFAAREVFVGTMATLYSIGDENNTQSLREKMRGALWDGTNRPVYTFATGISLLIFYLFALQCMSTIAVVYRETKHWKWPLIQFLYMGGCAYLFSFIAYRLLA